MAHGQDVADRFERMLAVALEEAKAGLQEGGVPIGAAVFGPDGRLLGRGRNRRVQDDTLFMHAETAAMVDAGHPDGGFVQALLVTTLTPCWWCSGLVRQFGVPTVVVGDAVHDAGTLEWLRAAGVEVVDMGDRECVELMNRYEQQYPDRLAAGRGLIR